MGGEGETAENAIKGICLSTGLRILGPNCMGVYNNTDNLNATYFWELPRIKGNVSFISQSGAFGGVMFNEIRAREMGVSKFFSIGNQADVTHADILEALSEDDDTKVIGLFIEGVKDGQKFLEAASKITKDRPVIAFKGGKSDAGIRAAASHTGSMAGSYDVYKAALEDVGVIVTEESEDFFDSLMALSMQNPPKGKRVAIMTISGGPSVVAGDICEREGIEVPALSSNLQKEILTHTPPFAATSNPVDMTPQMNPANYEACVDLVAGRKNIDGVIAINVGLDRPEFANAFIKATSKYDKPITSFTIDTPELTRLFKDGDVPIYPTPERAVHAYSALIKFANRPVTDKYLKKVALKPTSRALKKYITEHESDIIPEAIAKKALAGYGVPVVDELVVNIWSSTVRAAQDLGYPLAIKLHSDFILHKSDSGGVFLNIEDEAELHKAWKNLNHEFPSDDYVLQRMVPPGVELIIGAKQDPVFGPVVAVGLGGIFVELFEDIALGVCPVTRPQAKRMIGSLKARKILEGYRGAPGVNINALISVIRRVSDFMLVNQNIIELDINPLIANGSKLLAVDALMKIKR